MNVLYYFRHMCACVCGSDLRSALRMWNKLQTNTWFVNWQTALVTLCSSVMCSSQTWWIVHISWPGNCQTASIQVLGEGWRETREDQHLNTINSLCIVIQHTVYSLVSGRGAWGGDNQKLCDWAFDEPQMHPQVECLVLVYWGLEKGRK